MQGDRRGEIVRFGFATGELGRADFEGQVAADAKAGKYGEKIEKRFDRRDAHRAAIFALLPDELQADIYRYVADRAHMKVPPEAMLDPVYLATRAKLIDPARAQDFGPGAPPAGGAACPRRGRPLPARRRGRGTGRSAPTSGRRP